MVALESLPLLLSSHPELWSAENLLPHAMGWLPLAPADRLRVFVLASEVLARAVDGHSSIKDFQVLEEHSRSLMAEKTARFGDYFDRKTSNLTTLEGVEALRVHGSLKRMEDVYEVSLSSQP